MWVSLIITDSFKSISKFLTTGCTIDQTECIENIQLDHSLGFTLVCQHRSGVASDNYSVLERNSNQCYNDLFYDAV